jgi:hypothetical protein
MSQADEMQIDTPEPVVHEQQSVESGKMSSQLGHTLRSGTNALCAAISSNLDLINLAIQQFDVRFILRALRAVSSIRKRLPKGQQGRSLIKSVQEARSATTQEKGTSGVKKSNGPLLPEEEVYLAVLDQVCRHYAP